jgi:hypothetical protein
MSVSGGLSWADGLSSCIPNGVKSILSGIFHHGMTIIVITGSITCFFLALYFILPMQNLPGLLQRHVHAFYQRNPLTSLNFSRKQPDDYGTPFSIYMERED